MLHPGLDTSLTDTSPSCGQVWPKNPLGFDQKTRTAKLAPQTHGYMKESDTGSGPPNLRQGA